MEARWDTVYPDADPAQLHRTLFGSTGGYVHITSPSYREGIDMPARAMQNHPDVWKTFPFFNGITGAKFSLSTYKTKNCTESGNINSVTAFQVRLNYDPDMGFPEDILARFDYLDRKHGEKGGLFMPRPSYAILAGGLTFIYVLDKPFILNTPSPKKRKGAYKFLVRVIKGVVDRINWLDPSFGAVFSRLTLQVPFPGSLEKSWNFPEGFFGGRRKPWLKITPVFRRVHIVTVSGMAYPIQDLADSVLHMTGEQYALRKQKKRKKPAVSLKGQVVIDILKSFDTSAASIMYGPYDSNTRIRYRSLTDIMEDRARLIRKLVPSCPDNKRSEMLYHYANTLRTSGYSDLEIFAKLKTLNRMLPSPLTEAHLCCLIPDKVYRYKEKTFLEKLGITVEKAMDSGYPVSYFQSNKKAYHNAYTALYQVKAARKRGRKKLDRIAAVQKLRKEGMTLRQIAAKMKISLRTVSNYLKVSVDKAKKNLKTSGTLDLAESCQAA